MTIVTEAEAAKLPALSREELDVMEFGIVQVDDTGVVQSYNRYESELANVPPATAQGRNFFTQVAPCTNNRLVYGRFKEGVASGDMDASFSYTLTYKMRPTNVWMRLYRDTATRTNWVMVQKR